MGSCMSGNHGRRKYTAFADDLLRIDIADWRKRKWLEPGGGGQGIYDLRSLSGRVLRAYAQCVLEEREGQAYLRLEAVSELYVAVCATPQPLGGVRWWIQCPLCDARCGKLYYERSGRWGCRRCLELRYRTQHLGPARRARSRAEKYCERLDTFRWVAEPRRPRGMHRRTFERLLGLAAHYEREWTRLGVVPMEADYPRFRRQIWKRFPKAMRPVDLT